MQFIIIGVLIVVGVLLYKKFKGKGGSNNSNNPNGSGGSTPSNPPSGGTRTWKNPFSSARPRNGNADVAQFFADNFYKSDNTRRYNHYVVIGNGASDFCVNYGQNGECDVHFDCRIYRTALSNESEVAIMQYARVDVQDRMQYVANRAKNECGYIVRFTVDIQFCGDEGGV